jgi:phosphoglycolate phosphatase
MIGDRGVDMRAARHHGLLGIGALWGYGSNDELASAGAHVLCDSPAGLTRSIQSLMAR